jgi:hypothetical protein
MDRTKSPQKIQSWEWWLMSVIPVTWEEDHKSRTAQAKSPGDPISTNQKRAGHGGVCLSFQLCRKHKQEDHTTGQLGCKARPYLKNKKDQVVIAQMIKCLSSKALSSVSAIKKIIIIKDSENGSLKSNIHSLILWISFFLNRSYFYFVLSYYCCAGGTL